MNQVTPEQKDSVTKTFAIVGFVAAILFAVWLAVQVVSVIPSAFSSLASIADGVYNYNADQELTVATKSSVVNTGEPFTLSWTQMNQPGTYTFSYQCTEGTSIEIINSKDSVAALDCGVTLALGEQTELTVAVTSEKQRFTDVTYTIVFVPDNASIEPIENASQITIVNVEIPTGTIVKEDANENTDDSEVTDGVVAGESTTNESSTDTSSGNNPVAGTPTAVEEIIYEIPTSNPNGKIDLNVTYLGVGKLSGKTFLRSSTIDKDEQGAFQFAVQNIGTKTSGQWDFEAVLPAGIEYTSGPQVELKPNEKAIITIGFEGLSQTGTEKFGVEVSAKNDINKNNNSFTWAVEVVK